MHNGRIIDASWRSQRDVRMRHRSVRDASQRWRHIGFMEMSWMHLGDIMEANGCVIVRHGGVMKAS